MRLKDLVPYIVQNVTIYHAVAEGVYRDIQKDCCLADLPGALLRRKVRAMHTGICDSKIEICVK